MAKRELTIEQKSHKAYWQVDYDAKRLSDKAVRDKANENTKRWKEENPDKVKKQRAEWQEKNKEVRRVSRKMGLSIPQARAFMGIAPVIYVPASHFGKSNYENIPKKINQSSKKC